ncbi:isopenicillin N synthase family oxygenase [Streptomyces boluensis]|uniref:Isopenicillin N synthase family oxygenase n=1 Tax=Streptomyces boluensis TaxID=1775135 RepID=A0A964UK01_9ACTN|nr:isopenicillin N synthase family oxygenase [Streptomyces boluensis]NBE50426.1 isopenicillin N synthase family oxygenase [Streptomyces boluensis]
MESVHGTEADIPSVDLDLDLDSGEGAVVLGEACRRLGFFFARRHGVPEALMGPAFAETRRFYARPDHEKRTYAASARSQFLGYRGVGQERSTSHAGGEACEQFRIGGTTRALAVEPSSGFFHGPFANCSAIFESLVVLGDRLLAACAEDLSLDGALTGSCQASPMHRLGLNSYRPGHGADIANTVDYAMSPHIDHAYFTVVLQDEPGLQVQDENGVWLSVPLVPDAVFVFLGDYLQRATNGIYRAATHRVGAVSADRISIQYKHRPAYSTVVAPLGACANADTPPRYEPFDTGNQYASLLQSLLDR